LEVELPIPGVPYTDTEETTGLGYDYYMIHIVCYEIHIARYRIDLRCYRIILRGAKEPSLTQFFPQNLSVIEKIPREW